MLFERNAVEQDTGLLKPRYLQDGSTLISAGPNQFGTGGVTMHTVTAGKTFYLSMIVGFDISASSTNEITVTDDGSGKVSVFLGADQTTVVQFPTPIPFTTNVRFVANSSTAEATMVGWEE